MLLQPHRERYSYYSRWANEIFERYTDLVEPFGIDESWLDITGTVHLFGGDPVAVAGQIRRQLREELGLTASVGVSFNKVFAKLGSDYRKPDATTVISPDNWRELVWPLPVGALLFVGRAAQQVLHQYGIETIGQLAAASRDTLETLMGKMGVQLWDYANGLDRSPVRSRQEQEPVKSVGNGTTFRKNLTNRDQVATAVSLLSDQVASRLRKLGLYAGGVQVTLRNPEFRDRSRQKQFPSPTHLMRELRAGALELVDSIWQPPSPIRMLTVTAIHLADGDSAFEQVDLLAGSSPQKKEKQEKLESAMDAIRLKYGNAALRFGAAADQEEDTQS